MNESMNEIIIQNISRIFYRNSSTKLLQSWDVPTTLELSRGICETSEVTLVMAVGDGSCIIGPATSLRVTVD